MQKPRDSIVAEAKTWIGVPYRHLGRNKNGVDCLGVVIKVAHGCGLSDFDTANYSKRPDGKQFIRGMREHMQEITLGEVGHGDVAVFREPRHPCHCGIVEVDQYGTRWLIHSYAPYRKVVREHLHRDRERDMMFGFRFPDPD